MNMCVKGLAGCFLFAAAASAQAPVIGGLANNYSYISAGLPNYGIAQGSIFDIFGTSSNPATFTAPNMDFGYIGAAYGSSETVTFQ